MTYNHLTLILFIFIGFSSCKNDAPDNSSQDFDVNLTQYKSTQNLFKFHDPKESGILFNNELTDQMIYNIFYYEYSFNGGGVAIGDINNDGLDDILFSSTIGQNRLYLNEGNLKFKDITQTSGINQAQGINTGISFVDINADGFLDIFINRSGNLQDPNTRTKQLFINNKNLTFQDEANKYGLDDKSYTTQTYFYDFDLDGDLDVYILNHPIGWGKQDRLSYDFDAKGKMYIKSDTTRQYVTDRLLFNENGKFVDRTKQSGIENLAFGLSANIGDFNGDAYPDIYVANDYVQPDQFMINNKGKSFKNEINQYFKNIPTTSMGGDVFDANNDGELDIFINDMMPETNQRMKENRSYTNYDAQMLARKFDYHDQFRYNAFQIKNRMGKFSNVSQLTGTAKTDWSWAVLGEDYDQNGHTDLFITNGYYKDLNNADYASFLLDSIKRKTPQKDFFTEWKKAIRSVPLKNYFFANQGDMEFDNVSNIWDSGEASFSNGAAYSDLDNDGDLDIVVNNINSPAFIMENTLNSKKKIQYVDVALSQNDKNRFSIGAEMTMLLTDGTSMTKLFNPIRGYMSSCSYRTLFGIPEGKTLKSMIVKWPNGSLEEFAQLKLNSKNTLSKGTGVKYQKSVSPSELEFDEYAFNWKHKENEYIDFKGEPLLHLKNSTQGPAIACGDLNGDGKDDVFFGGAANQASTVFFRDQNGWKNAVFPDFIRDSMLEDVDAEILDFDKDGDNDILVVSGGYEWNVSDNRYTIRIYVNNEGQFSSLQGAFENKKINGSCIELVDVDNDKDFDVFIGGGATPNKYPYGENSFLFLNENGIFKDKTKDWLPQNGNLGIVRDAKLLDVNNDKFNDLVIGGDWQEVRILLNEKGKKYTENQESFGLSKTNGLWQSFWTGDLDGDGDFDIIAGNLGKNAFFKANEEKPTCIFAYDYDENKEIDAIMCTYFGNKLYPVHSRDRIVAHMTKMRKKLLRYRDYSTKDIDDLFDGKHKKADVFNIYSFASCAFINENGKFTKLELPNDAQLSMVNGIDVFNNGKANYIVASGNFWDTDFDFGKYDASVGSVLKFTNHKFEVVRSKGFNADQNIRKQRKIKVDDKTCFLEAVNNGNQVMFCVK